mmetsp:Transcript_115242/g.325655  ORF Transcript_115242/g.325655 Transcript_115242/m.325655 type:complete len:193 (-) Transcript_115242:54-632(-)
MGFFGAAFCLLVRTALALAFVVAGAFLSATAYALLNDVAYGHALHRWLAGVLGSIPAPLTYAPMVVLPPLLGVNCAAECCCRGRRQQGGRRACGCCTPLLRAAFAGVIAGVLLGVLASKVPGPYYRGVIDNDIVSWKEVVGSRDAADSAKSAGGEPNDASVQAKVKEDESKRRKKTDASRRSEPAPTVTSEL